VKVQAQVIIAAMFFSTSLAVSAQTDWPVTRAQVRAELVQLEKAGYQPQLPDPNYPASVQQAEARVVSKTDSSYGAPAAPAVSSGNRTMVRPNDSNSLYFGR
jgi:hypothetical protein